MLPNFNSFFCPTFKGGKSLSWKISLKQNKNPETSNVETSNVETNYLQGRELECSLQQAGLLFIIWVFQYRSCNQDLKITFLLDLLAQLSKWGGKLVVKTSNPFKIMVYCCRNFLVINKWPSSNKTYLPKPIASNKLMVSKLNWF